MRRFFRGFVIFSLLAVIAAGGVLYGEKCREADHLLDELTALRLQNETDAASAARSLSDALGELRTGLRKLSAAGTPDATARLFAEVRRLSDRAGGALGTMNLSHVDGAALGQFLTRTGDYADTLLRSVQGGTMLSDTDTAQLDAIHTQLAAVQNALDERISIGALPDEAVSPDGYYTASESDGLPAYPAIEYSGLYGEACETAEPRGLPDRIVSQEEADRLVRAAWPDTDWQFAGRREGAIATFDFIGPLGESASITERGGKRIAWMIEPSGRRSGTPAPEERSAFGETAKAYLADAGFGAMQPTVMRHYTGAVVLRLCAMQDGVLLLPDSVDVWLDRDTGRVIGFDARAYYQNHTLRELSAPTLTAEEAKTELSPALTPDTVTLCLLCRGTEETLCYACRAAKGERTYIVYLNAQTGTEEEIQELQTSEDGEALR